ncbi:MAG: protein sanA-like protein, partial [Mastigocladus sp. ERB_26_2]
MKRSVLMAKDLGMDAYSSPTPTTRYQSFNTQVSFLMRETYFYFVYLVLKI